MMNNSERVTGYSPALQVRTVMLVS